MTLRLTCLVGLLCLGACGPGVAGDGDGSESGDAESGTTEATTTDDPTTSADETTETDTTTTGNPTCDALLDDPTDDAASTVMLVNDTAEVLFVGFDAGCGRMPFHMEDPDATPVQWQSGDCAMSCEDVLAQDCFWCGACEGPSVVRLAPGDSWEQTWSGALFERVEFPAECSVEAPCEQTCERRSVALAPEYRLRTEARTECEGLEPAECECPDGEQTCVMVMPNGIPPATMDVEAVLAHPGMAALVFE